MQPAIGNQDSRKSLYIQVAGHFFLILHIHPFKAHLRPSARSLLEGLTVFTAYTAPLCAQAQPTTAALRWHVKQHPAKGFREPMRSSLRITPLTGPMDIDRIDPGSRITPGVANI